LLLNTGNINCTIPPGGSVYVFDNANVTEGVSIANFHLSINSIGNSKHITSSLDQQIDIEVIADLGDCDTKNYVSYTTDSGIKTEWTGREATNVCNNLKSGLILSVEPATNSNIITWTDGTSSLSRNILQILIVLLGLTVVIVVISFSYIYARDNFDDIKLDEFVKYGITVLLVLILVTALILYIVTIL
jgi:hypothetical protein